MGISLCPHVDATRTGVWIALTVYANYTESNQHGSLELTRASKQLSFVRTWCPSTPAWVSVQSGASVSPWLLGPAAKCGQD